MRRNLLIVLLALGTVGGFASGFAHLQRLAPPRPPRPLVVRPRPPAAGPRPRRPPRDMIRGPSMALRVLCIDDDERLHALLGDYLRPERRDPGGRARRPPRPRGARRRRVRCGLPRRDDAGHGRPRGHAAHPGEEHHPGDHAHRPGRRDRPRGRPRARRRRLPPEALQRPRAPGPAARRAPAGRGRAATERITVGDLVGRRPGARRPRCAGEPVLLTGLEFDLLLALDAPGRARRARAPRSWTRPGAGTRSSAIAPSTCTSPTCARSWATTHARPGSSRPCAASVISW